MRHRAACLGGSVPVCAGKQVVVCWGASERGASAALAPPSRLCCCCYALNPPQPTPPCHLPAHTQLVALALVVFPLTPLRGVLLAAGWASILGGLALA